MRPTSLVSRATLPYKYTHTHFARQQHSLTRVRAARCVGERERARLVSACAHSLTVRRAGRAVEAKMSSALLTVISYYRRPTMCWPASLLLLAIVSGGAQTFHGQQHRTEVISADGSARLLGSPPPGGLWNGNEQLNEHCEPIRMSLCDDLQYNMTIMPNLVGHNNQVRFRCCWYCTFVVETSFNWHVPGVGSFPVEGVCLKGVK